MFRDLCAGWCLPRFFGVSGAVVLGGLWLDPEVAQSAAGWRPVRPERESWNNA